MLENLLKQYDNLGDSQKITKTLELLEQANSIPISDCQQFGISQSSLALLHHLGIIKADNERISLARDTAPQEMPLIFYQLLFQSLQAEALLHEFLNEKNIYYDYRQNQVFIKNNRMPLKFSAIRNLLLNFTFFIRDELITSQFYIHPDYQEWFCENIIPIIETSQLKNNPLKRLIAEQKYQMEIGQRTERFVLEYEKQKRQNHNKAENIKIVSDSDTSAGYDILSYEDDNSLMLDKYIEVKSYTGNPSFYWSENEVRVAKEKREQYYLYLINRDEMENQNYNPIIIRNPFSSLWSDFNKKLAGADWNCRYDGYFFEQKISQLD